MRLLTYLCAQVQARQRQQLVACSSAMAVGMQRFPLDVALQHAGLSVLQRVVGCAKCCCHFGREAQETASTTGGLSATIMSMASLMDRGGSTPQHCNTRAEAISEGLLSLHFMCANNKENMESLISAGGLPLVTAAMRALLLGAAAQEAAVMLLAGLVCLGKPSGQEALEAVDIVWRVAGQEQHK
jgi:hypothetical protein